MTIRQKALDFATLAHEGQVRKNGQQPYITHPIAVAEIALELARANWNEDPSQPYNEEWLDLVFVVALLHDTIEDTSVTYDDIVKAFGSQVANHVRTLTKVDETYLEAILRAKQHPITRIVKIADNIHNSSDLGKSSLKDKYSLSKYILEH